MFIEFKREKVSKGYSPKEHYDSSGCRNFYPVSIHINSRDMLEKVTRFAEQYEKVLNVKLNLYLTKRG